MSRVECRYYLNALRSRRFLFGGGGSGRRFHDEHVLTVWRRQMVIPRLLAVLAIFIGCSLFGVSTQAADLTGVWVTDASACGKVFVKNGTNISFVGDSDIYGGGFIIEGNRIRGKLQTCNIKLRKEDGPVTHIIAVCSTDVALSTLQVSVKIENENKITRLFPGVPELATSYFRCSL